MAAIIFIYYNINLKLVLSPHPIDLEKSVAHIDINVKRKLLRDIFFFWIFTGHET